MRFRTMVTLSTLAIMVSLISALDASTITAHSKMDVTGVWFGTVSIPGADLPFMIEFDRDGNFELNSTGENGLHPALPGGLKTAIIGTWTSKRGTIRTKGIWIDNLDGAFAIGEAVAEAKRDGEDQMSGVTNFGFLFCNGPTDCPNPANFGFVELAAPSDGVDPEPVSPTPFSFTIKRVR